MQVNIQIVASADVASTDEDLRHGRTACNGTQADGGRVFT